MSLVRLLPAVAVLGALAAPLPNDELEPDALRAAYHECFDERAEGRLAQLWLDHRGLVLPTIDADLEGSLALWEQSPDAPDADAIARLHERALFGAQVASEVTSCPIFADYASSFVGWDDDQKRRFRAGQAAYGDAMTALRDGEPAAALEAARACTEAAQPLGDWWGTAMGLSAEGLALSQLDRHDEALVASSRARLLYDQLGLVGSEYGCLRAMIEQLVALERWPRARVTIESAITTAETLGDERGAASLRKRLDEFDAR